jgi:hypothetical protein
VYSVSRDKVKNHKGHWQKILTALQVSQLSGKS